MNFYHPNTFLHLTPGHKTRSVPPTLYTPNTHCSPPLSTQIARLSAINRRLTRTVSLQRLDAVSGPESDVEDADDYRLNLDDAELKDGGAVSLAVAGRDRKISTVSTCSERSVTPRERRTSTSSERSITPPNRENITRKTSHTLAEAFLEQLPEVRHTQDDMDDLDAEDEAPPMQNGSAPHLEMEAC